MLHPPFATRLAATAAGLIFALPASAEPVAAPVAPAGRADPSAPRAPVPPLHYRSAFSDYRPLTDGKLGWRQANDEVGRIGGWRTYAREANAPEAPALSPAPAAASAPPDGGTSGGAAGGARPPASGGHGAHGPVERR